MDISWLCYDVPEGEEAFLSRDPKSPKATLMIGDLLANKKALGDLLATKKEDQKFDD